MKAISARKVLIRAPNWVGDAVMAEPSLRRLRDVFSHAHLTILAPPSVAGLYEGEGLADEIVVAEGKGVRIIAESRLLRRHRFDLAILLQNAFSAALLARASGIRKIAGYPTDGRRLLLDPVIPLDGNHKTNHQVFYYMKIASFIESAVAGKAATGPAGDDQSLSVDAITPRLRAAPEATDRAFRLLKQELTRSRPSHSDDSPLLVLNPGATNSRAKRWLPDRFADLADQLSRQIGFQTVIIGVAGDIELCQAVAERMETRGAVLAGKTDTADLKGLLSQAALVVSNDTGSAHVAAALGIPTIVIFGPTQHFVTRPYSHNAQVVRHQVECSPCMLRDCPIDHRCMTGVQVSDVREAVERLMALKDVPAGVNSVAHT